MGISSENLVPEGKEYETEIPDTLDLAEHARLAMDGLYGGTDHGDGRCEMYFMGQYYADPPFLSHNVGSQTDCDSKYAEAWPQLRLMAGSDEHVNLEQKFMAQKVGDTKADGLLYSIDRPDRPWHSNSAGRYPPSGEEWASIYGTARHLLAMTYWYQRNPTDEWLERIERTATGLMDIVVEKDDYAYYPNNKTDIDFARPESGYDRTEEPASETDTKEGSILGYQGHQLRALARYYELTGDERALKVGGKLSRFIRKPKFWGDYTPADQVVAHERGWWGGHHHHMLCVALRGLLEYALATDDAELTEFVRSSYEYGRNFGIARIGLFGEGCATADMVALAIRLSDAGVADYWDHADQYIRNQLVEYQVSEFDLLKEASEAADEEGDGHMLAGERITGDEALERSLGTFVGNYDDPTNLYEPWMMGCCTGNCSNALYYAWEGITRCTDVDATVNLLLNRESPWLDVRSSLPYEGRVVLEIKDAKTVSVRIPSWVDREAIETTVDGEPTGIRWVGNYLQVTDDLSAGETVAIEFPVVETTETCTIPAAWHNREEDVTFSCEFRGNTLVDISPRDDRPGYPIYRREELQQSKTPTIQSTRFEPADVYEWC